MAEVAGPEWRPEYAQAWAGAYELVQGLMLEGAALAVEAAA